LIDALRVTQHFTMRVKVHHRQEEHLLIIIIIIIIIITAVIIIYLFVKYVENATEK